MIESIGSWQEKKIMDKTHLGMLGFSLEDDSRITKSGNDDKESGEEGGDKKMLCLLTWCKETMQETQMMILFLSTHPLPPSSFPLSYFSPSLSPLHESFHETASSGYISYSW